MCDPVSIGMAFMAVAGAAQAHGERQSGIYANKVAKQNAGALEAQADDARTRGAIAEDRHRMQVRQFMGRQRAQLGGSGTVLDQGTALDMQVDSARMGELDALMIRNNAAREAWGFNVNAWSTRTQGKLDNWASKQKAMGTLLGTGASMAGMYAMGGGFGGGTKLSGTAGVNQPQPNVGAGFRNA